MGTREAVEKYVGKKATVRMGGLVVEVEIKDFKMSYGRERYLITPIAGEGEVWVETITLDGVKQN